MSRNKKYHLRRVEKMQSKVKDILEKHKGLSYTEIYRQYIDAEFDISYSTYCNWLGKNPKKELKQQQEKTVINQ